MPAAAIDAERRRWRTKRRGKHCAGKGRYGMLLWVKPKDYAKAARILKAK